MKNNALRVLVVLIGLTLAPSFLSASGAQRKSNSWTQTSSFSVMLRAMQAPSNDYKELPAIAAQAFETLSPATKKWFAATAEEYASKQPAGGSFDSSWATKTLIAKFSGADTNRSGDLMMATLFYLCREASKEAREGRNLSRWLKQQEINAKEAKLNAKNQTIDQQRKEADERFDSAMAAADREMWIGVMSTLCSTLHTGIGSLLNSKQPPAKVDDKNLQQAVIRKLRAQLVALRASGL